jgi:hypothetical protein
MKNDIEKRRRAYEVEWVFKIEWVWIWKYGFGFLFVLLRFPVDMNGCLCGRLYDCGSISNLVLDVHFLGT